MPRPVSNPPNPWLSTSVEWLEEPPPARLEVFEETARSLLTQNESPDVPFRWSVNPYRGCMHACAYCYARPGHQVLGFGAGTDFERKIVVKLNAPELLRRELGRRGWDAEPIVFSGVTDCYQPLEASYELTRRCLEACLERRNPAAVVTKGALVRRDADLLADLERAAGARVYVSIPFADESTARRLEPGASAPGRRFETLAALASRGIPTGVAIAPLIPGLNEAEIPAILRRARRAGARHAFLSLLRLPAEVRSVFRERLEEAFPARARKVLSALREARGGRLSESRFGARMTGSGPRWRMIAELFELERRRLGYEPEPAQGARHAALRRAPRARQGELFDA